MCQDGVGQLPLSVRLTVAWQNRTPRYSCKFLFGAALVLSRDLPQTEKSAGVSRKVLKNMVGAEGLEPPTLSV